ncbi:bifunctional 5,10-methylenetetrahydrofolate dehydrogenase/5,10-methenyltetrahydrofolate cyclohydrolase [Candidatus Pacearchaeota archaeon]|nr:bifunctional 5,10-methylenetetrahydrofolate dehydrogenase/5,10-methenyltetrahydrofolate cyclohydrolase [Candidatus Pacearchaeota archaeon]
MAEFFPCDEISQKYFYGVRTQIELLGRNPFVKLFLASEDKGSASYSKTLTMKFQEVGIDSQIVKVNSPAELERGLLNLDKDEKITGGFVFYPINFPRIKDSYFMRIVPEFKDIEGLSANNVYRLAHYERNFPGTPCKSVVPCTAKAIVKVLLDSNVEIKGQDAVIINKSYSLGAPLRRMLDNFGATVVACDINTKKNSIEYYVKNADIVVTAVPAKVELFDDKSLKEGASIIDCSFESNFDLEKVSRVAGFISSRQSGNYIGPVTTSMAAVNVLYLLMHRIYTEK